MTSIDRERADALLTPEAIRAACAHVLAAADAGELRHFKLDRARLAPTADIVIDTMRDNYPDLEIPFHARWRHFRVAGVDRWQRLSDTLDVDRAERLRMRFDLAIVSVLLDAGAGSAWRYRDLEGGRLERSEGLAIASLEAFAAGLFSSDPAAPLRVDGAALSALTVEELAAAFQVAPDNPLVGLEGRAALLNGLGDLLGAARLGDLADVLAADVPSDGLPARDILVLLLRRLGAIWPGRITLGGVNLGDTWRHDAVPGDHLVPFHKLSQWLAYSLIEPLEEAGVPVVDIDALTALAEYRNGGLLVDSGVLLPAHEAVVTVAHAPGDAVIVEWRALTVALLDELAGIVREKLGKDAGELPLARILEGGTWAAGRRLALARDRRGNPPITIRSDGSVF